MRASARPSGREYKYYSLGGLFEDLWTLKGVCKRHSVNLVDFNILRVFEQAPASTPSQVARITYLAYSPAIISIKKLLRLDYLIRDKERTSRREGHLYAITEAGREVVQAYYKAQEERQIQLNKQAKKH